MRKSISNNGSITIEATLALSFFLFAFVILVSFANVARTESIIQHALNQSAKEVSQYLYVADKTHLTRVVNGDSNELDTMISNVQGLYQSIAGGFSKPSTNSGSTIDILNNTSAFEDPSNVVQGVADLFKSQLSGKTASIMIAPALCDTLLPKYILPDGSRSEVDSYLKAHQIENGLNGLDFNLSTILLDGRTINLVTTYRIKSMIPGFFNKDIVIKQTASTAAWIQNESLLSEEDSSETSKWQYWQLDRGKAFLAEVRQQNSSNAVAPGVGIDLYDAGVCTSYFTINIFNKSYSTRDESGNYQLNTGNIEALLTGYSKEAQANVAKLDQQLKMNDGRVMDSSGDAKSTIIHLIAPEEAISYKTSLDEITKSIEQKYGVTVVWSFQEKAFLDET